MNVHYGTSHSGIGTLEELRFMDTNGKTAGHQGEEDIHVQHVLAEANNGNADALTFIAKKYYWGSSGLPRNVTLSRTYFEKASALGNAEAMYNMGIFHESGQGGLSMNLSRAIECYKQAANATKPYQKAIHSLGLYYLSNTIERNFNLAKKYFIQAAELNSEEAHFELGHMYLHGQGSSTVDIPRAAAHFAVAASMGHFKAINFLSLALYDSTSSWLSQYGRLNKQRYRQQVMMEVLSRRAQQQIDEMKMMTKKKSADEGSCGRDTSCCGTYHYSKVVMNNASSRCNNSSVDDARREQDIRNSSGNSSSSIANDTCEATDHLRNESMLVDDDMTHVVYHAVDHACIINSTCTMGTEIIDQDNNNSSCATSDDDDGINASHNSLSSSSSSSSSSPNTTTSTNSTATNSTHTMIVSTNETDLLLYSSPYFTNFDFIRVFLPDGSIVPLPFPLGSTEGACESALLLLKYLADMSYRTKDVSRRAIDEYIRKDYWSSIELLEEASNYGVKSTQENAAYLYEKLMKEEDGECSTSIIDIIRHLHSRPDNAFDYCSNNPRDCCLNRMRMMKYASFRQWKKLVQSGEPLAMRKVADSLLYFHSTTHDHDNDHEGDGIAAAAAAVDVADAKMLYLLAAGRGDTQSLMQLGWMLFSGRHG